MNGPISLNFEAWEDDPDYLTRRAYHHYLGPLAVPLEKAEQFTQVGTARHCQGGGGVLVLKGDVRSRSVWESRLGSDRLVYGKLNIDAVFVRFHTCIHVNTYID